MRRRSTVLKSNSPQTRLGLAGTFGLLLLFAGLQLAGHANAETVIVREHVSTEWADVLRVTPVLQTVTASRNEQVCDNQPAPATSKPSKWIESIRDLGRQKHSPKVMQDMLTGKGCRIVKVERQFERPIAYDVDYTYRGMKFRTRLPKDPGSRLRIRVGVTPIIE